MTESGPICWDDPNWGHNPVHIASSGTWLDAEPASDQ